MSPVSDLQLSETKHLYTHPNTRKRYPGVTSIIGTWADGDKAGRMAGAAVRLTRENKDYRAIWKESADTGKRVHANGADWGRGKATDVLDVNRPRMNALAAFMKAKRPEWLEVERAILGRFPIDCMFHKEPQEDCEWCWGWYGGRFDAVMFFDNLYWLIDFKTGKHYGGPLELQLAGYASAQWMIVFDKKGMAVGLEPMPHIDRMAGLYLDDAQVATLVEVCLPKPRRNITREMAREAAVRSFRKLYEINEWATIQKENP